MIVTDEINSGTIMRQVDVVTGHHFSDPGKRKAGHRLKLQGIIQGKIGRHGDKKLIIFAASGRE